MNENLETQREYDILGLKLKVSPEKEGEESKVTSQQVVDFVQRRIKDIKDKHPALSDSQVAVLLAMDSTRERMELEADFKQTVDFYDTKAQRVKDLVDSITPSYN
ncbi:MAG: hypothetical protein CME61_05225 [Halobacteriovoraceae bacterium]|nr:hypothetical protein [Halobacteriovoraceae bacterium]|tara:strand:+ start:507 stop:821 length:315 start_codon:yes stop_codon:yes gene_type:complete